MSGSQELEKFRYISGDRHFREWLETERADAVKTLAVVTETVLIARAQGKYQLVTRMLELLDKAKDLR